MGNNVKFTAIHNYSETVDLSALFDINPDGTVTYCMVSISIKIGDNFNETYDNDRYIFDDFKPYLDRWKSRRLTSDDMLDERFMEIHELLNDTLVDEILEIIEDGIKLGWHKLKK